MVNTGRSSHAMKSFMKEAFFMVGSLDKQRLYINIASNTVIMHQDLDEIDAAILRILQNDSTISIKDIASEVGLSATPTHERIKHLEESGVIRKYVALVDREKVGINLLVYCNVVLKEQSKKALVDFEKAVSKIPQVLEVISVSGTYDYMLKIAAADINAYNDFIMNKLANIPNIGQYHSNIVLSEAKRETAYPVNK